MNSVIDPWVAHYERLMDILSRAGVSKDLTPRSQRKILITHKGEITDEELREALLLFNEVYKKEM